MQEQLQLKASKKTGVAMHPLSRASVYTQDHTEKVFIFLHILLLYILFFFLFFNYQDDIIIF